MHLVTVPAKDEYLIRHAAHVCQHADQHFRDVNLHLRHNRDSVRICKNAGIGNDRIYTCDTLKAIKQMITQFERS